MKFLISVLFLLIVCLTPPLKAQERFSSVGISGEWVGNYSCSQRKMGAVLAVQPLNDGSYQARFSYYSLQDRKKAPEGELIYKGRFDIGTGEMLLKPVSWIKHPPGHGMIDIYGRINTSFNRFDGKMLHRDCGVINLARRGNAAADVTNIPVVPAFSPRDAPTRAPVVSATTKPRPVSFRSVAQIRAAAVPFGGDCNAETAAIRRVQRATRLKLDRLDLKAGETFNLNWSSIRLKQRLPIYLMVSFDQPVRFEGKGFYALLPRAQAAFGITWNADKTRAIVPFYGQGIKDRGEIEVKPLLSRKIRMEWSVVGYLRRCQNELPGRTEKLEVNINTGGHPQVVVEVKASLVKPDKVFISPDGSRILETFKGRYRLADRVSGGQIIEVAGTEPIFSPTGRFIIAKAESAFEIRDAVDGAKLNSISGFEGDVSWKNRDSLIETHRGGRNSWGVMQVAFSTVPKPSFGMGGACRTCDDNAVLVDLENNLFFGHGGNTVDVRTITHKEFKAFRKQTTDSNGFTTLEEGTREVRFYRTSGDPYKLSKAEKAKDKARAVQKVRSQLAITAFDLAPRFAAAPSSAGRNYVQHYDSNPKLALIDSGIANKIENHVTRSVEWRGLARVRRKVKGRSILNRMLEMGIPAIRPQDPAYFAGNLPTRKDSSGFMLTDKDQARETPELNRNPESIRVISKTGARAIANTIIREIPRVRGVFGRREHGYECGASENNQIITEFDQVFSFSTRKRSLWITRLKCQEGTALFHYPTAILFDSAAPKGFIRLGAEGRALADPNNSGGTACESNIANCHFYVRFYIGQLLVFWSRDSRAVALYDLAQHKTIYRQFNLERGDLLGKFEFSPKWGILTQVNSDGSFFVYRLYDKKRVLEGRYVDDEIIIWTPEGHYDASAEGAHYVNLKFPGQPGQYSFQQFEKKLRVPGLVQKVLRGERLPPVNVGIPPSLSATLEAGHDGRIIGTALIRSSTDTAGVNVYQDGVLTDKLTPTEKEKLDINVSRLPGARWVSAVAVDAQGLASLPMGRDVGPDLSGATRVHLLGIGIDAYQNLNALRYAGADAMRLSSSLQKAMKSRSGIVMGERIVLRDGEASSEKILEQARRLATKVGKGDTIVFSFAGHGVRDQNGRFYLATSRTEKNDIAGTALPWTQLAKVFAGSKARVVVILDACHAGVAGTSFFATNDDAASGVLANSPSNVLIFAASKGREFSEEKAGGGVFTNALAEVIAGNRGKYDRNGNGVIEVSELYYGVKSQVVSQTDGRQTPWLARNQMVGDFALF